jgi:hypothetical protein
MTSVIKAAELTEEGQGHRQHQGEGLEGLHQEQGAPGSPSNRQCRYVKWGGSVTGGLAFSGEQQSIPEPINPFISTLTGYRHSRET